MRTLEIANFNIPTNQIPAIRQEGSGYFYPPGFRPDEFRSELMGTSDCNSFIPLIGVLEHNLFTFEDNSGTRVLEYTMPRVNVGCPYFRQYNRFIDAIRNTTNILSLAYTLAGTVHRIFVHRGILYDSQGNILMCIALDKDYVMSTPVPEMLENIDESKVVVFISQTFDNPIYKNVRKKLDTMYLDSLRASGIDIIHTNKINSWLFKNNYRAPQFRNVRESVNHLRREVPKYLLID